MKTTVYFLVLILPLAIYAQSPKTDKVLMTSGEVKQGQVIGVDDQAITFVHQNEAVQYTLKKTDISKIEFASGRIEVYNPVQPEFNGSDGTNLADHHNKVAVLPFNYIRDGAQLKGDIMEKKVQREFFSLMKGHVGVLKIEDPEAVNAALIKHNINGDNIYQFTMPELANFLGVEYIVQGTLTINQSGTSSFGSTYGQAKSKSWNKVSGFSLSSATTSVQYHTVVDIVLFNDSGEEVYSQTKESVWPNDNAYDMTFRYLIKRMPIYSK